MYRDDLISVGYCFFYFAFGQLPWSNISIKENSSSDKSSQRVYPEIHILHEKNRERKKQKEWKNIELIVNTHLNHKNSSPEYKEIFTNIFEYFILCYNLGLDEQPFYEELCQVLQKNL
jgi:hypothetical protein